MIGNRTSSRLGDPVAGNGILSRRVFLEGALIAGAMGASMSGARTEPLAIQPWMKMPGAGFTGYGQPSRFEAKVVRFIPHRCICSKE
jgi:sulfane dehydrogenase subunit SoxC